MVKPCPVEGCRDIQPIPRPYHILVCKVTEAAIRSPSWFEIKRCVLAPLQFLKQFQVSFEVFRRTGAWPHCPLPCSATCGTRPSSPRDPCFLCVRMALNPWLRVRWFGDGDCERRFANQVDSSIASLIHHSPFLFVITSDTRIISCHCYCCCSRRCLMILPRLFARALQ